MTPTDRHAENGQAAANIQSVYDWIDSLRDLAQKAMDAPAESAWIGRAVTATTCLREAFDRVMGDQSAALRAAVAEEREAIARALEQDAEHYKFTSSPAARAIARLLCHHAARIRARGEETPNEP